MTSSQEKLPSLSTENKPIPTLSEVKLSLIEPMSIEIAARGTQISVLKRSGVSEVYISALLLEVGKLISFKLNAEDVRMIAKMICSQCWMYKIDEVVMIFQIGMNQKMFGTFSWQVFNEWREIYDKQKENFIMDQHVVKKETFDPREPMKEPKMIDEYFVQEEIKKLND
jgi:hypothetical protein